MCEEIAVHKDSIIATQEFEYWLFNLFDLKTNCIGLSVSVWMTGGIFMHLNFPGSHIRIKKKLKEIWIYICYKTSLYSRMISRKFVYRIYSYLSIEKGFKWCVVTFNIPLSSIFCSYWSFEIKIGLKDFHLSLLSVVE